MTYDVTIIGAGIIGLATALQIQQKNPDLRLAIVEKEDHVAEHQSGHNSGVIHSGIYYKPGSMKAKNCIQGVKELKQFCNQHKIPYDTCGKVIVATEPSEIPRLEELLRRGLANGVSGLQRIGPEKLKEIEPNAFGIDALFAPNTAIVDFQKVAATYAKLFQKNGGDLFLSHKVLTLSENTIETEHRTLSTRFIINCSGIFADRIAYMIDHEVAPRQIIPFRGEYYDLIPEKRNLIRGLIYPVPNPKFPFLGVHVTKMMGGTVEAGPNAVLAFSREGYQKGSFRTRDLYDLISYPGFWKMAIKYWNIGLYELARSFSKGLFLKSIQRLVPEIQIQDLIQGRTGVRSQIVLPDGKLADDFVIVQKPARIHVLSAPSPGATASLSIGKYIAGLYENR